MKPITTFSHNGKSYEVIERDGKPELKLTRSKPVPKPGIYPANVTHELLEPGDKIWIEAMVLDFSKQFRKPKPEDGGAYVQIANGDDEIVKVCLNHPELRVFVGNPVHSIGTNTSADLVLAGDLTEANVGQRFEIVEGAHKLDVMAEGYSFTLASFGKYGDDGSKAEARDWAPNRPDFDYIDNKTLLRRIQ